MLDRNEGADQIGLQDALPLGGILLEQAGKSSRDARVGEHHIESPAPLDGGGNQGRHLIFITGINHDLGAFEIGRDHGGALLRKKRRCRFADAAARTRDNGDFTFETAAHSPTPMVAPPSTMMACPVVKADAAAAR